MFEVGGWAGVNVFCRDSGDWRQLAKFEWSESSVVALSIAQSEDAQIIP